MYIVKVILMPLLKNMSHQKVYILILFVVDGKVGKSTLLKKNVKQIEFIQEVVLVKVSTLNVSVMEKTIFFSRKKTLSLALLK